MASDHVASLYNAWKEHLSESSSLPDIERAFTCIEALSNVDLLSFCTFSEALPALKTAFANEVPAVRYLSIRCGGRLLVRLWVALHAVDVEGCFQFESLTDAQRRREDMTDFITEHIKLFAKGAIGQQEGDELAAANACCLVLGDLLGCFHGAYEALDVWVDSMCGIGPLPSQRTANKAQRSSAVRTIELGPLVQAALTVSFEDPWLLMQRAQAFFSYQNSAVPLVNNFFLTILQCAGTPEEVLVLPGRDSRSAFATITSEITAEARQGIHALPILLMAEGWVDSLLHLLGSALSPAERVVAARDLLLLLQQPLLAAARRQHAQVLLAYVLALLEDYEEVRACVAWPACVAYDHLAVWGLGLLRSMPVTDKYVDMAVRLLGCIRPLEGISGGLLHGRLTAELVMALLDAQCREEVMAAVTYQTDDSSSSLLKRVLIACQRAELNLLPCHRPSAHTEGAVIVMAQALLASMQLMAELLVKGRCTPEGVQEEVSAERIEEVRRIITSSVEDKGCKEAQALFNTPSEVLRRFGYLQRRTPAVVPAGCTPEEVAVTMAADHALLAELFMTFTEDAVYVLQAFAPCFRWKEPATPSHALLALAHFLADALGVSSASSGVLSSILLPAHGEEVRGRAHMVCLILLSLLDGIVKTCNITSSSSPTSSSSYGGNQLDMLACPHIGRLIALIAVYALPYAYAFSGDLTVLLGRVHFVLFYAGHQMYNMLDKQSIADKLIGRASVGFLGGLSGHDHLIMDCASSQACLHQLHAIELVTIVADAFDDMHVLKVVAAFLLDLQANLLYSLTHASCRSLSVLQSAAAKARMGDVLQITANATAAANGISSEGRSYKLLSNLPAVHDQLLHFISCCKGKIIKQVVDDGIDWQAALSPDIDQIISDWLAAHGHAQDLLQLPEVQLLKQHLTHLIQCDSAKEKEEHAPERDLLDTNDLLESSSSIITNNSSMAGFYASSPWQLRAQQTHRLTAFADLSGMFSASSSSAPDGDEDASTSSVVHAADYCGAIYDVISSRLTCGPYPCPRPSAPADQLSAAMLDYNDICYTQVSGSNDLLTVLAAVTAVHPVRRTVTVQIKIVNASAFKIPYFTIEVLLAADHLLLPAIDTALFSSDELDMGTAIGPAARMSAQQLLGGEYLPPGAMVQREAVFEMLYFAPVRAVLRIVYPDLANDLPPPPPPPPLATDGTVRPKYAAANAQHRAAPQDLAHYGAALSQSSADAKWTALLDCQPLPVPLPALLVPYGQGVFCSLQRVFKGEEGPPGISWKVFRAMFLRLGSRYADTVPVLCLAGDMVQQVIGAVQAAVQAAGGIGMHFLGTDCMAVRTASDASSAGEDMIRCGEGGAGDADALGWCLQTIWGAEVAIALAPSSSRAAKDVMSAQLQIRCSSSAVLAALLMDMEGVVQGISGGCLLPSSSALGANHS